MFNRGHLFQLLYMVHDYLVLNYQYDAASKVMDLIQEFKQLPNHELQDKLENYKPRTLVNTI